MRLSYYFFERLTGNRARRETILQQEKLAKEEEEREKRLEQELEERKKQSHDMLAEELRREKEEGKIITKRVWTCTNIFI